jgi:hypothetical protein
LLTSALEQVTWGYRIQISKEVVMANEGSRRFCAGCGAALSPGARFCEGCGQAVSAPSPDGSKGPGRQAFCTQCGAELGPAARFCKSCGAAVSEAESASPVAPPAAEAPVAPAPRKPRVPTPAKPSRAKPPTAPAGPAVRKVSRKRLVVGLVLAGVSAVLLIYGFSLDGTDKPGGRSGGSASEGAGSGLRKRPPLAFNAELGKAILATPALAARLAADGKTPLFRATGKLQLVDQSPRADGSHVLRVWASVESRPAPGRPALPGAVLLKVMVDSRGRVVGAQSLGSKDADTAELESLLDKL